MARRRGVYISSCLKWTMFIFNFLFWIFGLLIAAIGAYGMYFTVVDLQGKKSLELFYIILTDLSGIFVALGIVIVLVSFAGCIGALRENICLLKLYFWFLTLILIVELLIAVACIVFPWKSRSFIESVLSRRLIEEYRESENTQDLVDFLQKTMECCGMTSKGYLDWDYNEYFNCTKDSPSVEKCAVPPSCCIDFERERNMMCGYGVQNKTIKHEAAETIHTRGCISAIIYFLESNMYTAAGIILGFTTFQMYVTHQARTLIDQIILQRHRWYS